MHDHGDGTAVQVSNMISWTVHVRGDQICSDTFNAYSYSYTNGTANTFTATVHTYILVSGPAVVTINGVVQTERLLRTR